MTLTIAFIVILNLFAHLFLMRFFKKTNPTGKMTSLTASIILLIPPIALFITVFLVGLGLIIRAFDKSKRKR